MSLDRAGSFDLELPSSRKSNSSETESDDDFFDAEENTPKSRSSSLRRSTGTLRRAISSDSNSTSTPMINISHEQDIAPIHRVENAPHPGPCQPPTFSPTDAAAPQGSVTDSVLPEEITKELEALSKVDDARRSRIERLEKIRRGEGLLLTGGAGVGDDDDDEEGSGDVIASLHESAESSVEGIYATGPRSSHPFKVIESEPDRRSVSSDSRSVHGRQTSMIRLVSSESMQKMSSAPVHAPAVNKTSDPPSISINQSSSRTGSAAGTSSNIRSSPLLPSHIPDVVSSAQSEMPAQPISAEFRNPIRPPRRKKSSLPTTPVEMAPKPLPIGLPVMSAPLIQSPQTQTNVTSPITPDTSLPRSQPLSASGYPYMTRPNNLVTSTPRGLLGDDSSRWDPLPSPDSTVASLTRELETSLHTLDLHSATKGLFVVKPQDDEKTRGESNYNAKERSSSICVEAALSGDRPFPHHEERTTPARLTRDDSSSYSLPADRPSSPEGPASHRIGSMGNRSLKGGSSGSGQGNVGSSLGSHYNSANSGCSSDRGSGGKRSLNSGSSMDSNRESSSHIGLTKQMNLFLRTKSESGKKLSDEEILKQIKVKNLDTGEEMDLVEAEDKLPPSINPLSLHIMRLTSEYVSGDQPSGSMDSDTESMVSSVSGYEMGAKKKRSGVKRFFGSMAKKTSDVAKSLAAEATKATASATATRKMAVAAKDKDVDKKLGRLATEIMSSEGVPAPYTRDGKGLVFKRIQAHKSGPFDFEGIKFAQELTSTHLGPIWCMRFSHCGQLLATAGQDTVLRIWVLKSAYNYFKDMRNRYNADVKSSPTNSYENVISDQIASEDKSYQIFVDTPFCSYMGHTSDLLDISWSKNYFILTSSMDKTVRLWHISRRECLCCFQHIDFVTAISFHPRNDQFFLSGSLDGKLRLWNIPDKKVALWNEVDGPTKLITTANFIQNGKFAVVGTYDGRCIFYSTDQLKYYTMIHVRSARGKNAQGRKVTGIEPMPGEDKILVTSNDSRIRLYDLRDLSLSCKYRGYTNSSSQIRATFSPDGKYLTAGSENQCVYLWRTQSESTNLTVRKDRNSYYEAIKAHNAVVTCSVFAPNADIIFDQLNNVNLTGNNTSGNATADETTLVASSFSADLLSLRKMEHMKGKRDSNAASLASAASGIASSVSTSTNGGYVLISGDYDGDIKVFLNAPRAKHSSLPSPTTSA